MMTAKIFKVDFKQGTLESVKSDSERDNLSLGTVLETEGYGTRFVIVKNMGKNPYGDGVIYKTVNLETFEFSQQESAHLKWLKDKKDYRIQSYITNEVMPFHEVKMITAKATQQSNDRKDKAAAASAERKRLAAIGRELFAKHIPADAKALIIAERHVDECDPMSDHYSHKVNETVIIGYSMHTRDLFSEMRKAADGFEETKHLGAGKGHFEPYVAIGESFCSNARRYREGEESPWHREEKALFSTRKEAEEYIQGKGILNSISVEDRDIPLVWKIDETNLEHREKWSMGAGYYLKDGSRDSSGWCVRKVSKYGEQWDESYFVSIALRCIFKEQSK